MLDDLASGHIDQKQIVRTAGAAIAAGAEVDVCNGLCSAKQGSAAPQGLQASGNLEKHVYGDGHVTMAE